eukprot:TRINITY_DN10567_c0_g1_i1.p1 TRINITY_DN10567_c0_g1~~TRINITY_DN10567_c0_g1_i1.p1  ORF type:complete len:236 (-),score=61.48 TRINITY_DN10567_c0_g1_i1:155-805(-)
MSATKIEDDEVDYDNHVYKTTSRECLLNYHGGEAYWETNAGTAEIDEMKKKIKVNCLRRGKFEEVKGKVYMVAVDGTPASKRAFHSIYKLCEAEDHLFVVNVRPNYPDPADYGLLEFDDYETLLRAQYDCWNYSRTLLTYFLDILSVDKKLDFTILTPLAEDPRKLVCFLVKEFHVSVLGLGKHGVEDKASRKKNQFLRSFTGYCKYHAKCQTIVF